jgi:ribonucleotide reductase beta subunit family protein with ferritin-like domain
LQIESLLQTANEQRASLQEAKAQLHVLDDSTLVGVIKFFTTQKKDLWLFDEQLNRWRAEELTMTQRAAIERLTRQMRNLHEAINTILALADELKEDTIEKVLAKGDAKRGLEMLVQLWKHEQEG